MTPAQCREARSLVGMSQAALASVAAVSAATIADFETGAWIRPADLEALRAALERAGVELIEDGVKLRDHTKAREASTRLMAAALEAEKKKNAQRDPL